MYLCLDNLNQLVGECSIALSQTIGQSLQRWLIMAQEQNSTRCKEQKAPKNTSCPRAARPVSLPECIDLSHTYPSKYGLYYLWCLINGEYHLVINQNGDIHRLGMNGSPFKNRFCSRWVTWRSNPNPVDNAVGWLMKTTFVWRWCIPKKHHSHSIIGKDFKNGMDLVLHPWLI